MSPLGGLSGDRHLALPPTSGRVSSCLLLGWVAALRTHGMRSVPQRRLQVIQEQTQAIFRGAVPRTCDTPNLPPLPPISPSSAHPSVSPGPMPGDPPRSCTISCIPTQLQYPQSSKFSFPPFLSRWRKFGVTKSSKKSKASRESWFWKGQDYPLGSWGGTPTNEEQSQTIGPADPAHRSSWILSHTLNI